MDGVSAADAGASTAGAGADEVGATDAGVGAAGAEPFRRGFHSRVEFNVPFRSASIMSQCR